MSEKDFEDGMNQGYEEAVMSICDGFMKLPYPMAKQVQTAFRKWLPHYMDNYHKKEREAER